MAELLIILIAAKFITDMTMPTLFDGWRDANKLLAPKVLMDTP
jgi:hypothetical protein